MDAINVTEIRQTARKKLHATSTTVRMAKDDVDASCCLFACYYSQL
jgi:hypothetical protein